MHSAVNVKRGKKEDRPLLCVSLRFISNYYSEPLAVYRTGLHTVADVFCVGCNERLGWYYHKAADAGQKYKEGKTTRQRSCVSTTRC